MRNYLRIFHAPLRNSEAFQVECRVLSGETPALPCSSCGLKYADLQPRKHKNTGFTLVEVIASAFILMIIFAALFSTLNIGVFSDTVGGAKLEAEQEARMALDWMTKDLRQTSRNKLTVTDTDGNNTTFAGLMGNNTVFAQPRFYLCTGYNTANSTINWTANETTYDFDVVNKTLIRIDSGTGQVLQFNGISNLTFTKTDLNSININITAQKVARGNATGVVNLIGEIKLRNE